MTSINYPSVNACVAPGTLTLVFLAVLSLCSRAHADIYQLESGDDIHLSNLIDQTDTKLRYVVLVSEPAALTNDRSAPDTRTSTRPQNRSNRNNRPYADIVHKASQQTRLDPALLYAVMATESANNPQAVSPSGARGLMQLMPATARRFNVADPHDPQQNINAGAHYLQELQAMFKGNTSLMLAAYNAGPNAVIKHGYRIPPYAETLSYVPRVLNLYNAQSRMPAAD